MSPLPAPTRTVLCLVNAAPNIRPLFCALVPHLESRGYRVTFALDSHLTDFVYPDSGRLERAWYFTDFIYSCIDNLQSVERQGQHSWAPLFSDFDRFLTMEIVPPLFGRQGIKYQQVPALLHRFFTEILETEKPVAILYEQVSNSFAQAAYECAKVSDIPFCSVASSRIPGRMEVSLTGGLRDHETIGAIFEKGRVGAISEDARRIASQYRTASDPQIPDYMVGNPYSEVSLRRKYLQADKMRHVWRSLNYSVRNRKDWLAAYQHGDPIVLSIAYFRRALRRRLRMAAVVEHLRTDAPKGAFVLYPLHYHPEASTSIHSPDYVEELSVVKAIAFRLPTTVSLVVKEHPTAIGLRPLEFYKQLSHLPNVHLVGSDVRTKDLIHSSLGVVCLTSTVGFEAAVVNKPVVVFGRVFYQYFPNVRRIEGYGALSAAINWLLGYRPVADAEILEATAAYVQFTRPGTLNVRELLSKTDALDRLAGVIADSLQNSGISTHEG